MTKIEKRECNDESSSSLVFASIASIFILLLAIAFALYQIKEILNIHLITSGGQSNVQKELVWDNELNIEEGFRVHYPSDWNMEMRGGENWATLRKVIFIKSESGSSASLVMKIEIEKVDNPKRLSFEEFFLEEDSENTFHEMEMKGRSVWKSKMQVNEKGLPTESFYWDSEGDIVHFKNTYYDFRAKNQEKNIEEIISKFEIF